MVIMMSMVKLARRSRLQDIEAIEESWELVQQGLVLEAALHLADLVDDAFRYWRLDDSIPGQAFVGSNTLHDGQRHGMLCSAPAAKPSL